MDIGDYIRIVLVARELEMERLTQPITAPLVVFESGGGAKAWGAAQRRYLHSLRIVTDAEIEAGRQAAIREGRNVLLGMARKKQEAEMQTSIAQAQARSGAWAKRAQARIEAGLKNEPSH